MSDRRLIVACLAAASVVNLGQAQDQPAPPAPAAPPAAPVAQPATPATPVAPPAPAAAPAAAPVPPPAAAAPVEPPVRRVNGGIALNFQDAPLDTVLSYLSEVAGLVIIRGAEITGRVTVISRQPLTVEETITVLNSVLKEKGFAAVRTGKTLKIVQFGEAKRANIPVHVGSDPESIAETDEVITQVIGVKHVDAVRLKTDLQSLISETADVSANGNSNTLIMTDSSANIKRFAKIIAALDTAVAGVTDIKVFPLQYANATDAARLINDIFREGSGRRGGSGSRGSSDAFQRYIQYRSSGGDSRNAAQAIGGTRPEVEVTASADERTNTVVVSGPPETLETVGDVIRQLDANPISSQGIFHYAVKNGTAANMQTTLSSIFGTSTATQQSSRSRSSSSTQNRDRGDRNSSSGSSGGSSGGPTGFPGAPGSPSGFPGGGPPGSSSGGFTGGPPGGDPRSSFFEAIRRGLSPQTAEQATDLYGQVHVVANADTNSLLVMTNPKLWPAVEKIIHELDRAVPQVLIKVLIAEVTHNNTTDLGTEWSVLNVPGASTIGTDFGLAAAPGGLVYRLITDEVTATIKALEEVGNLEVLSRPYILASDNQAASITVGSEVPFIRNTRVTETGQTINTIQYDDVGIILNVTPHINPDGIVVLDVAPEISAISGDTVPISETVNAPVIAKRSAQTRVAIKDGQTIVIGGLMEDQLTKTESKVPLLGDIPIVGLLFKRQIDEKRKTELLIFLTPHVAKLPDELKPMTEDEKSTVKLAPNAVKAGEYQRHLEMMERGAAPMNPPAVPDSPVPTIPREPGAPLPPEPAPAPAPPAP